MALLLETCSKLAREEMARVSGGGACLGGGGALHRCVLHVAGALHAEQSLSLTSSCSIVGVLLCVLQPSAQAALNRMPHQPPGNLACGLQPCLQVGALRKLRTDMVSICLLIQGAMLEELHACLYSSAGGRASALARASGGGGSGSSGRLAAGGGGSGGTTAETQQVRRPHPPGRVRACGRQLLASLQLPPCACVSPPGC